METVTVSPPVVANKLANVPGMEKIKIPTQYTCSTFFCIVMQASDNCLIQVLTNWKILTTPVCVVEMKCLQRSVFCFLSSQRNEVRERRVSEG